MSHTIDTNRLPAWKFTSEVALLAADHTNSYVRNADLAVILDRSQLWQYNQAASEWRQYPRSDLLTSTGSTTFGSTNTRIRRMTATVTGEGIYTWTDSATLGTFVTADSGESALVTIGATYTQNTSSTPAVRIAINVSGSLTNTFFGGHTKAITGFSGGAPGQYAASLSWTGRVQVNEVMWLSTEIASATGGSNVGGFRFDVTRLMDWQA